MEVRVVSDCSHTIGAECILVDRERNAVPTMCWRSYYITAKILRDSIRCEHDAESKCIKSIGHFQFDCATTGKTIEVERRIQHFVSR